MVTPNKQPGVYITENTAFPNSIVEVATAVPAFIGYTEKAEYKGQDLRNKPWRIDSMTEYIACFGGPPSITFRVTETAQSGETKAFTAKLSSSGGRVIGQEYYVHPSTEPNQ
jgi:phage tail sheath protein FI